VHFNFRTAEAMIVENDSLLLIVFVTLDSEDPARNV
jgi:hypothetical protein